MKIAIIAFSKCGAELAKQIIAGVSNCEYEINGYISKRHRKETDFKPFSSIYELTVRLFSETDALIFIGACGIAVRAVAPLIKSKLTDPAIVVCDETGQFAISLLSGHLGGANELASIIARVTGAQAVITTASDAHTCLCGEKKPKNLILGIGCRRGVSAEVIERAVTILLWDKKIPLSCICGVATIDSKRNEKGLIDFTDAHKLPLHFYSAMELSNITGEFSSSERVQKAVGVDNVCERAAVLLGEKGKLIVKKNAKDGVTVAVFEKE